MFFFSLLSVRIVSCCQCMWLLLITIVLGCWTKPVWRGCCVPPEKKWRYTTPFVVLSDRETSFSRSLNSPFEHAQTGRSWSLSPVMKAVNFSITAICQPFFVVRWSLHSVMTHNEVQKVWKRPIFSSTRMDRFRCSCRTGSRARSVGRCLIYASWRRTDITEPSPIFTEQFRFSDHPRNSQRSASQESSAAISFSTSRWTVRLSSC